MQSVSTRFGNLTTEGARRILAEAPLVGDTHGDRVAAFRKLEPVVTRAEIKANKQFKLGRTYACVGCKKFAFPEPRTRCYWCRNKGKKKPLITVESTVQASQPTRLGARPTLDQVREYIRATKANKKGKRGAR